MNGIIFQVQDTIRMIRDISKTAEAHKSGPDVKKPYQSHHVIPGIGTGSLHHNEDKTGPKSDKNNPWVPLPRINGDKHPGIVIGSSHQKSGVSRGLSLPGSPKHHRPSPPFRHHHKVPPRARVSVIPASDYQRKVRGKLGQNPTKRNRRQPKRLNDSVRRSGVKKNAADKIDISQRTKISSGLALSAIAILLAI